MRLVHIWYAKITIDFKPLNHYIMYTETREIFKGKNHE